MLLLCDLSIVHLAFNQCFAVAIHLPKLQTLASLRVSSCSFIDDESLSYVSKIPSLQSFQLVDGQNVTNIGIQHLSTMSTLTELLIDTCYRITDMDLKYLPSGLTKLTVHNIRLSHGLSEALTDAGLLYLSTLENLANLEIAL